MATTKEKISQFIGSIFNKEDDSLLRPVTNSSFKPMDVSVPTSELNFGQRVALGPIGQFGESVQDFGQDVFRTVTEPGRRIRNFVTDPTVTRNVREFAEGDLFGGRNIMSEVDELAQAANRIDDPTQRRAAQFGVGQLRTGALGVQGLRDVTKGSVGLGKDLVELARYDDTEGIGRNIGNILGGSLEVLGAGFRAKPFGQVTTLAENTLFQSLKDIKEGKAPSIESITKGFAEDTFLSDALNIQNPLAALVADVGVNLALGKQEDKLVEIFKDKRNVALVRGALNEAVNSGDLQKLDDLFTRLESGGIELSKDFADKIRLQALRNTGVDIPDRLRVGGKFATTEDYFKDQVTRISEDPKASTEFVSDLVKRAKAEARNLTLEKTGDNTYKLSGQQEAFGALAGFEPEFDQEGNLTGINYDPVKGATGVLLAGSVKDGKFDLKNTIDGKAFKNADDIQIDKLAKKAGELNFKTLGETQLNEREFSEMMIKGIDLEDPSYKSAKNFPEAAKQFYNGIFRPIRNMPEDLQTAYRNFYAKRGVAREIANQRASKFFNIPEARGWKVIKDIELGRRTPETKAITKEFDDLFNEARKAGIDIGYLNNYVTHIWEQRPEDVAKISREALGQGFKFSGERGFPTYEEGLAYNKFIGSELFVPKYTHPAQIIGEYTRKLEDTKANMEMFKWLKDSKYIVPEQVGRELGYQPVFASYFPKSSVVDGRGTKVVSNFYAPPEFARVLNTQFNDVRTPGEQAIGFLANLSGKAQDITLTGGYKTLNFWSIGQMMRHAYAGLGDIVTGHPVRGFKRGFISPFKAFFNSFSEDNTQRYMDANKDVFRELAEEGVSINRIGTYTDKFENILKKQSLNEKAGKAFNQFFNEPTFKRFMPMLQANFYKDTKATLIAKGMGEEQARRLAASQLKNFEGIVNTAAEGRSPQVQQSMKAIFFAPRYREGILNMLNTTRRSIGLTKNPIKALRDPSLATNRSFAMGTALMYGVYNMINTKLNGHDMVDNPPGRELHLQIPLENGDIAYVPLLPSVFFIPRTAIEGTMAIAKGDLAEAKRKAMGLVSQPIQLASQVTSNMDYFGNPIAEEDDPTLVKYRKLAGYIAGNLTHPYIREVIAVREGRKTTVQGVLNALELPIKFTSARSAFWKEYFGNKEYAEQFKVLSEEDPAQAQAYYNENKEKIDRFVDQKLTVAAYGDLKDVRNQAEKQGVEKGVLKQMDEQINNLFRPNDAGPTVLGINADDPSGTYARLWGTDTYLKPRPSGTEGKIWEKNVLKDAREVYNHDYIPAEAKDQMITSMGLDPVEVELDAVANKTVLERAIWVRDQLAKESPETYASTLTELINQETLSGGKVITKSVAEELGLLSAYKTFKESQTTKTKKPAIKSVPKTKQTSIKPRKVETIDFKPTQLSKLAPETRSITQEIDLDLESLRNPDIGI